MDYFGLISVILMGRLCVCVEFLLFFLINEVMNSGNVLGLTVFGRYVIGGGGYWSVTK